MADIKLTKTGLRDQQMRLGQLVKYLPTLKLKKAMLQVEVSEARQEIVQMQERYDAAERSAEEWSSLLTDTVSIDPLQAAKILKVGKRYENIAGVEVPYYEGVTFAEFYYPLVDTPPWIDGIIIGLKKLAELHAEIGVIKEKKEALESELRNVSVRVNLFEKILIPRSEKNIKKIKVFLGDQQLAAVGQVKVAKIKIQQHKKKTREAALEL